MADIRRHTVFFSDREIVLVEYALRTYALVMQIQVGNPPRREADDTARVAAVVQHHFRCKCPVPIEEGASP